MIPRSFSTTLEKIRKSAAQDEELTILKGYINTGFSTKKKYLPTELHELWAHKEMLSIELGLITCSQGDETRDASVHT